MDILPKIILCLDILLASQNSPFICKDADSRLLWLCLSKWNNNFRYSEIFGVFGSRATLPFYKLLYLCILSGKNKTQPIFLLVACDSLCIEREDYLRVVIFKIKNMVSESVYYKFDSYNQNALYIVTRHFTSSKSGRVETQKKTTYVI